MALSTGDLQALSRLLEEGLALPDADREAWLAALGPADAALVPRLRRLLALQAAGGARCLDAPPPLAPVPWLGSVGERVGPYRLVEPLGRGGMGEVWRAARADGAFDREVALKRPRARPAHDLAARLQLECQMQARLAHRHIARLYDAGLDDQSRPWLASELIDGLALDQHAATLPWAGRLLRMVAVARAVAHAHGRGVLHRDLKPANVRVDAEGEPHLLDFGIATLLDAAPVPGEASSPRGLTPQYAAPEQLAGAGDDVRADVYSLGVMLRELLALPGPATVPGRPPRSPTRTQQADLAAVVARATAVDPAARYDSASALADELQRCLDDQAVAARPQAWPARAWRQMRRHRGVSTAGGLVLLALAGAGGLQVAQQQRLHQAEARERAAQAFVAELFGADGARLSNGAQWLDRGVQLIETRFAAQAEVRERLLALLGRAYRDMGDTERALSLQRQRWQVLQRLAPAPGQVAEATQELAQAQLDAGLAQDALTTLQALRAPPDQPQATPQPKAVVTERALRARVLLALGRHEDAAALLQALDAELPAQGLARADWQASRAEVLQREGRIDASISAYSAAADMADAAGDAVQAAHWRATGALWAAERGLVGPAHALFRRSQAQLRLLGGPHLVRAATDQGAFWAKLLAQPAATYAQADAGMADALAQLETLGERVPPRLLAVARADLGMRRLLQGDVAGSAAPILASAPALLADEQRPLRRAYYQAQLGSLASLRGQADIADRHWLASLADRVAGGQSLHPYIVIAHRALALNASMAGRSAQALQYLDQAPAADALRQAGHDPAWYADTLAKTRARVLLDAGDANGALALLQGRAPHRFDDQLAGMATGVDWLRGEALCRLGRHRAGHTLLQSRWQGLTADFHPHHPGVARLRALTAVCAQKAGDAATARTLAQQARAAFDAQPEVADYFKAPLVARTTLPSAGLPAR